MKHHTPQETKLITEGRDLLRGLADSQTTQRKLMYRMLICGFLERLEKEKAGESDSFFLGSVVFAAIHSLANEGAWEEANGLLDELGTMEDSGGTRLAADPAICLKLSELRKGLAAVQSGVAPDETTLAVASRAVFGVT